MYLEDASNYLLTKVTKNIERTKTRCPEFYLNDIIKNIYYMSFNYVHVSTCDKKYMSYHNGAQTNYAGILI